MILLPHEIRFALRANHVASCALEERGERFDPMPVVKLFSPVGTATWLASELAEDDDTLFGLADLGFGCPELGTFSLTEIASVRLPFGLGIERDIAFATPFRLSVWTEHARRAGSILWAENLLRRAAARGDDELPTPSHDAGDG
ncbi:MAG TPA: DUF2958 domain-containing protein [Sphingomonas sp.]|nr:DUF2958 domain-containing protein [Sphingomonas sp.]